jgi:hypothetical protein
MSTTRIYAWEDIAPLVRQRFDDFAAEFDDFKDPFGGEMSFDDYVSDCLGLLGARLDDPLNRELCKRLNLCVRRKIKADRAWLDEEVE